MVVEARRPVRLIEIEDRERGGLGRGAVALVARAAMLDEHGVRSAAGGIARVGGGAGLRGAVRRGRSEQAAGDHDRAHARQSTTARGEAARRSPQVVGEARRVVLSVGAAGAA
jgi:hypothetical protein